MSTLAQRPAWDVEASVRARRQQHAGDPHVLFLACRHCREQVVQFILQNTAADAGPSSGTYVDPYTGAAAYVPPAPGGSSGAPAGGTDPYTGSGAYVPQAGGGAGGGGGYGVTGGGADPYTGGGPAPPRHLPAKAYLIYDQVGAPRAGRACKLRPQLAGRQARHTVYLLGRTALHVVIPPHCRRCLAGTPSARRLQSSRRQWQPTAARQRQPP